MTIIDHLRIGSAVARYDLWLDARGVPRRVRRDLCRELRSNLTDATAHEGSRAALVGIGSPKALAYAAAEAHEGRPRWSFGGAVGLAVGAALFYAWMFSMMGFADGVDASGVTGREVSGSVFPWGSGASAEFAGASGGLSVGGTIPWVIPVAALLAFVVTARPWRMFTGPRHSVVAAPQG